MRSRRDILGTRVCARAREVPKKMDTVLRVAKDLGIVVDASKSKVTATGVFVTCVRRCEPDRHALLMHSAMQASLIDIFPGMDVRVETVSADAMLEEFRACEDLMACYPWKDWVRMKTEADSRAAHAIAVTLGPDIWGSCLPRLEDLLAPRDVAVVLDDVGLACGHTPASLFEVYDAVYRIGTQPGLAMPGPTDDLFRTLFEV